jgi:DNA polymerase III delta prime subunit
MANYRTSYHRGAPFQGQGSELDRLRHENVSLQTRVTELMNGSTQLGIVVSLDEEGDHGAMATVASAGGNITETRWPRGMALTIGCPVRLRTDASGGAQSLAIVSFSKMPEGGNLTKVERINDETHFECSLMNQKRLIFHDKHGTVDEPKVGDSVLLDPLLGITLHKNLGSGASEHTYTKDTGVSWEDIGGCEEAKKALQEALIHPITHADLYKKYKRQPSRGMLLHGPPGNGKSMLGKAAATALAAAHKRRHASSGFLYVKGPSLLDKWVGESEANVRRLFANTRAHLKKEGYPCVLFLDEADAVLGVRGANAGNEGMERTIVPMFLAELDGFEDSGCFFLLATNRPDRLDPAIVRDGRVDRKARVGRPTQEDASAILEHALQGKPHDKTCAYHATECVWNPERALYDVATHLPSNEGVTNHLKVTFGDFITGARLVGLVERATSYAIEREVLGNGSGIRPEDFTRAVDDAVKEERGLDHTADLYEWAETHGRVIEKVRRV